MPFTGLYERKINGKIRYYSARLENPKARWIAAPYGFSDGTHVDWKPKLVVELQVLKNFNTPPKNKGITPDSWVHHILVPAVNAKAWGFDVDMDSAGPKPSGKGWKKGLEEIV